MKYYLVVSILFLLNNFKRNILDSMNFTNSPKLWKSNNIWLSTGQATGELSHCNSPTISTLERISSLYVRFFQWTRPSHLICPFAICCHYLQNHVSLRQSHPSQPYHCHDNISHNMAVITHTRHGWKDSKTSTFPVLGNMLRKSCSPYTMI